MSSGVAIICALSLPDSPELLHRDHRSAQTKPKGSIIRSENGRKRRGCVAVYDKDQLARFKETEIKVLDSPFKSNS